METEEIKKRIQIDIDCKTLNTIDMLAQYKNRTRKNMIETILKQWVNSKTITINKEQ